MKSQIPACHGDFCLLNRAPDMMDIVNRLQATLVQLLERALPIGSCSPDATFTPPMKLKICGRVTLSHKTPAYEVTSAARILLSSPCQNAVDSFKSLLQEATDCHAAILSATWELLQTISPAFT